MIDINTMFNHFLLKQKKNDWDKYARIISTKNDEDLISFLPVMFDWIENIETPGAIIIYYRLKSFSKKRINEKLEIKIEETLINKKYIWTLWLIDLLEESEKKKEILEEVEAADNRFLILKMLDYENDVEFQNAGIEIGKQLTNFEIFIQPYVPQYEQRVWENCSKIVCSKSDKELEKFLPKIMMWLQDLNWYGSSQILSRLKKVSKIVLGDSLKQSINIAIENKDSNWLYNLEQLVQDSNEKERIDLIRIDLEIEGEEQLYLKRRNIESSSKYRNLYLQDLDTPYLRVGALSLLSKFFDDTMLDIFISLKDDSDDYIRRIVEKNIGG